MKAPTLKPRLGMLPGRPLAKLAPTPRPGATERIRGRERVDRNEDFLNKNPLCTKCLAKGVYRAARECDHVVPLWMGGEDTIANLQGLCVPCHREKSKVEAAARARGGAGASAG